MVLGHRSVGVLAAVVAVALVTSVPLGTSALAVPPASVGPNVNLSQAVGNQFEGSVAIDPTNPARMFTLGRDETGNLIGARSADGGSTWTHAKMGTSINSVDKLPPGWGNTSVTFDEFGNLFVVYLGPIPQTYATFALSTDGGATFSHQTPLASLTDQPVVAAGHGSVWVTYNRGGVNLAVGAAVTGLGSIGSFGNPETITGANGGAFGDIAVGPNGEVMVAFGPLGGAGDVLVSVDSDGLGPNGFSTPVAAAPTNVGGFTYLPLAPNWGIDSEAHLAWDHSGGAHNGRVYLAFLDSPLADPVNTYLSVAFSDDGGATWSAPTVVNDDASAASHAMPGFAIDQTTGAVGATWYDTRGDVTRSNVRLFGSVSFDGGASWSANFAISAGTSNQAGATPPSPIRDTDFGDYTGLAFDHGVMVPVWADNSNSTGDNPAGANGSFDLYSAVVAVAQPATAPIITMQPTNQTAVVGAGFSFTTAASGNPAPTAQWQVSHDGGLTFVDLAGATGPTYSALATLDDANAMFRVLFSNVVTTVATNAATLTVTSTTTVALTVRPATGAVAGRHLTLIAKVASPTTGRRRVTTGSVDFYDGASLIASASVRAGRARVRVVLGAGTHAIAARYTGSGLILPASSNVVAVDVGAAPRG